MVNRFDNPVFITGSPRSGTSMVAGVIDLCGAFTGGISKPHKGECKGFYENTRLHNTVLRPYFKQIGVDCAGQYPLPHTDHLSIPKDWKKRVEEVLKAEGYSGEQPWMYKSNKLTLTWPLWHYAFPEAKWVIVRRRTGDIIQSCLKTSFMKAFKDPAKREAIQANSEEEGWKWWVRQHEDRFVKMIQEGLNVKIVWPERMVNGNYSQMYETIEWLGLKWSPGVYNYIDPKFFKVRRA